MFQANPSNKFVPSKKVILKPENQGEYGLKKDNKQIKFYLNPQQTPFIDTSQTCLRMTVEVTGDVPAFKPGKLGGHSLIHDLRVTDGSNSTVVEELSEYNQMINVYNEYTANSSINHRRDCFEGRSANDSLTNQLYMNDPETLSATPTTTRQASKKVMVELPLHSGILGDGRVCPVIAYNGIRTTMNLEQAARALVPQQSVGVEYANGLIPTEDKDASDDSKADVNAVETIKVAKPAHNPFMVRDILYIEKTGASAQLGVITQMKLDSSELEITYIPNRADTTPLGTAFPATASKVYVKNSDRFNGSTLANVPDAYKTIVGTDVKITNVEMVTSVVQPPKEYVSALMKKVQSGTGLNLSVKTFSLQRVNLTAKSGLLTQNIPSNYRKVYSILSVPLDVASLKDHSVDSFKPVIDDVDNYQWEYGSENIPSRPIDVSKYNDKGWNALHMAETQKSLQSCGYTVRNLNDAHERFIISRAFAMNGHVADLSTKPLNLRVEYDTTATKQKVYYHYVCNVRNINISNNGVTVS